MPAIDASGIRVLDDLLIHSRKAGHPIPDCRDPRAAAVALDRAGSLDRYGRENFVPTLDEALLRARDLEAPAGPPAPSEKMPR